MAELQRQNRTMTDQLNELDRGKAGAQAFVDDSLAEYHFLPFVIITITSFIHSSMSV